MREKRGRDVERRDKPRDYHAPQGEVVSPGLRGRGTYKIVMKMDDCAGVEEELLLLY